jgi:hypothetical protein
MHIASRGTRSSRVIYPSSWIDHRVYDPEILSFYRDGRREDLKTTKILKDSERGEFIRFYDALYLWEQYVPKIKEEFDAEYYWINSISQGPEFADWLKDQFAYSYRNRWGLNYNCPTGSKQTLEGYNDLFPYQGLLKFNEDIKDFEYSLIESAPPEQDDLEELEIEMRGMISKIPKLEIISELEILSEYSTSSSYVKESNITKPNCLIDDNSFADEMIGRRCVVPVYPAGTRDTVILTKSSSNTIKLLERQMRHILEHIPESAVTLRASTFSSRMSRIKKHDQRSVHFLRDIKKCGLTFPIHNLVDSFIKIMEERFPCEFWKKFQIYKERHVRGFTKDPLEFVTPKRGYFLGMANHLATFFLIAINRLAIKKFYEEFPDRPVYFTSLIGNDDSDIAIRGNDDNLNDLDLVDSLSKRFSQVHASFLSAFGVWFNAKKSFLSRYSLFYEEYSVPNFQNKESRYALIMANCISLGHIRMAKHMLKSFLSSVESLNVESLQPMVNYATSFFGYEFYPEEAKNDYYLGGWIPKRTNFLSDALYDIEELDQDSRFLQRIFKYITSVESLNRPHASNIADPSDNSRPLGKAMGITGRIPPSLFGLCSSSKETKRFYSRLIDFERKPSGYRNLVDSLWEKHKRITIEDCSRYELYRLILTTIDCRIPPCIVKTIAKKNNWQLVNTSWCSFNELDVPNKTLKILCSMIDQGVLKSNLEIPMRDSWNFLDRGRECYYSDNIAEYPFSFVAKSGNARFACADSVSNSIQYMIDHGEVIEDLIFEIPKRDILPWRLDEDYTYHLVKSVEDMEDDLVESEDIDLTFIGSCIIRAQNPVQQDLESEQDASSEVFNFEGDIADDDFPHIEGMEGDHRFLERFKSLKANNSSSKEPEIPAEAEKIRFDLTHWMDLYNNPDNLSLFVHEPCETHSNDPYMMTYMFSQRCICCRFISSSPHKDRDDIDIFEKERSYPTREELLKRVGFEEAPDPFADDDSDMGMFGGLE